MDTTVDSSPLKRLCTFLLGLGTFALFGFLGVVAFKASGGDKDPEYDKRAEERIDIRKASDSAQSERMKQAPIDVATSVGTLSSKKATATSKPVPGTPAFEKWMADQAAAAAPAESEAGETEQVEKADVVKLKLEALPGGVMKYKQIELTAKAGADVELTFINPDIMQHNFLLLAKGSKDKVGAAADAMLADPNAMQNAFIPQDPAIKKLVLAHTGLVNPAANTVLEFKAPVEPGDYPYVCTFPGHWRLMFGTFKVTP